MGVNMASKATIFINMPNCSMTYLKKLSCLLQRQSGNAEKWPRMESSPIQNISSHKRKNSRSDNCRQRSNKRENQSSRLCCTIYTIFIIQLSACFIDVLRAKKRGKKIKRDEAIWRERSRKQIRLRNCKMTTIWEIKIMLVIRVKMVVI